MSEQSTIQKIAIIKERYEKDRCYVCGGELSLAKFEGHGGDQEYCAKCDKFQPNSESRILETIFGLLED